MRSRTWFSSRRGHLDRQADIERELKIKERAENDGRNNLPGPNATELTVVERVEGNGMTDLYGVSGRPAEPEQAGERRRMLDVDALSPSQATADQ